MALCHLRSNQFKAAYDYSKNYGSRGTHLGCAYVFAQACLSLGKYLEGITALERSKVHWSTRNNWGKHTETRRQHLPDAAAVLYLEGRLLQAHPEITRAIECYAEALKLNPFMWDAFTGLCELGVNVRMPNIFKMTPEMADNLGAATAEETNTSDIDDSLQSSLSLSLSSDPFAVSTNRVNGDMRTATSKSALYEKLNGSTNLVTPVTTSNASDIFETPSAPTVTAGTQAQRNQELVDNVLENTITAEPPQAPFRKVRNVVGLGSLGMESSDHAPPKMKSSTSRLRRYNDLDEMDTGGTGTNTGAGLGAITERKRTVSGHVAQSSSANSTSQVAQNPPDPMAPQRRSVRLLNLPRPQRALAFTTGTSAREPRELKKVNATGTKGRSNHSTVGRVVSGNRKHEPVETEGKETKQIQTVSQVPPPAPSKSTQSEKLKEIESLQVLLALFSKLGSGYLALSHYRCREALQIFNTIPQPQRETPWVLTQMGRAFFEQGSWAEAEKYYARVRTIAPARLDGLELYSTVLWQLKRDVELSFLAHEIVDVDRLSAQAWCIVGNALSLQKDHDQALKCFKRATHLDPGFAYAFTLQGHEHVANEEYDKAMTAFRSALATDNRHYRAWYGLAKVYEKQGKFDYAEQHYRTAAAINPTSAILVCCIGVVLEKMKKPQQALDQYTRSSELDPRSSLARYKKARVLLALGSPKQSLEELLVLKDIAPDEANVHFLLGKVYKILQNKGDAVKHFTTALNLDPKVRVFSHYLLLQYNLTNAGISPH